MGVSLAGWVAAAGVALGTPAGAMQCRLCGTSSGLADSQEAGTPVRIEVQTSLNFDRLILVDQGGGSVRLAPDGSRAAKGGVASAGSRTMVGSVILTGEPHRMIRVDLPSQIELWGYSGGYIRIGRIETDLPSAPRLDGNGRLAFRFGGEVQVDGDAEGDYRGDVPITVEYL